MKNKLFTLISSMFLLMVFCSSCDDDDTQGGDCYFWSMGKKEALRTVKNKIMVVYPSDNEDKLKEELAKNGLNLTNIQPDHTDYTQILNNTPETDNQTYTDCKKAVVKGNYKQIKSALPYTIGWSYYYWWVEKDWELIPSIVISLRLKNKDDMPRLEKLAKQKNVFLIGYSYFDTIQFACTKDSKCSALEMANIFYESGLCEFSAPLFGGLGELH